jgi:hypothetical protein
LAAQVAISDEELRRPHFDGKEREQMAALRRQWTARQG